MKLGTSATGELAVNNASSATPPLKGLHHPRHIREAIIQETAGLLLLLGQFRDIIRSFQTIDENDEGVGVAVVLRTHPMLAEREKLLPRIAQLLGTAQAKKCCNIASKLEPDAGRHTTTDFTANLHRWRRD